MAFSFEHTKDDGIITYKLSGDLIEKTQAQPLLDHVDEALTEEQKKFVVNMENVRYLNSSGLNALIAVLTKARKSGGEVVICNVSPKVKELLIITRLNTVFTVTDSENEALQKLKEI